MTVFGVSMFPTDYAIQPAELARAAEEHGFDSLWLPEHTHIPTHLTSRPELTQEYWHTHDPFVALTAAAAVTEQIKLATGILLLPEHEPIVTAKSAASLDMISGGRLILGIGAGWNKEELEDHGHPFKDRWAVTRESVLAMQALWTQEEAEFEGEHIRFEKSWSYPKPVQEGGPPIVMGAQSEWVYDRVADYCDGWMPIDRPGADLNDGLEKLAKAAEAAGRPMESLECSVFGVRNDEARANELIAMGFQRLIFALPPAPAETVLPLMDGYAELAGKLGG